jgi:rod shape-determining protein MreB
MRWRRHTDSNIAIDIGSSAVRVATSGRLVVDEPAVVAVDTSGRVLAVGRDALSIVGRSPRGVTVKRPIRDGAIADIEASEQLLAVMMRRAVRGFRAPAVVAASTMAATGLERRAIEHALLSAGARRVALVESPMAAAIGVGLPVEDPYGSMVVDIGRGATEAAVISMGAIVSSSVSCVAGAAADAAIASHLEEAYGLCVGEISIERVKLELSEAADGQVIAVGGVATHTGLPRVVQADAVDLRHALDDVVNAIAGTAKAALDNAPPALAADVMQEGIVITGGSSLLVGAAERIAATTGVLVRQLESPEHAVIDGVRACLGLATALKA